MSFSSLLRRPAAFLPLLLSLACLLLVVGQVIRYGTAAQADEGAAAHLFQLLMVVQLPIIALFAVRWLPANPREATLVLFVQLAAVLVALAPVFVLRW